MFDIETIHHRAYEDAMSAANVYFRLCELSGEETIVEQYHFKKQKAAGITPKQVNYLKSLIERHNIKPDYIIENLTKARLQGNRQNIIRVWNYETAALISLSFERMGAFIMESSLSALSINELIPVILLSLR